MKLGVKKTIAPQGQVSAVHSWGSLARVITQVQCGGGSHVVCVILEHATCMCTTSWHHGIVVVDYTVSFSGLRTF